MGFTVAAAMLALAIGLLFVASSSGGARGARRTELARAREGQLVELLGVVHRASVLLTSPISGNVCCGYTVTVRRQGNEGWAIVLERSRAESLIVVDSTARAVVRARALNVDGLHTERILVPAGTLPSELAAFAAAEGLSFEPGMVVTEAIVREGDRVRVTGRAHREAGAAEGHYRKAAEEWVIREPPAGPLNVTVIGTENPESHPGAG